jgi:hypothetical protein
MGSSWLQLAFNSAEVESTRFADVSVSGGSSLVNQCKIHDFMPDKILAAELKLN